MPIAYDVSRGGHFVHAVATNPVTREEFIEYEIAHALDERIKTPWVELLEMGNNVLRDITKEDISQVLRLRAAGANVSASHRCAIVVSYQDEHTWDLAKFYEEMAALHSPGSVIVFGDIRTAKLWLGVEDKPDSKIRG